MIDYWHDLVNYKQEEKKYRYFRAEVDEEGEVCGDVAEVNFIEERDRIKEQIQEDILSYFDSVAFVHNDHGRDDLCQIVVNNFKDFH